MVEVSELQRLGIFRRMSHARLSEALAAFIPCEIGPGEVLMREGESDRAMVLLMSGEASVHIGEARLELTRVGPGELVGDMTLFGHIDRRAATVISSKPCRILLLDEQGLKFLRMKRSPVVPALENYALRTITRRLRETGRLIASVATGEPDLDVSKKSHGLFSRLGGLFGGGAESGRPDAQEALEAADAFRGLPGQGLGRVASHVQIREAKKGTVLCEEGDAADGAWVVASGAVDLTVATLRDSQERIARLREGAAFGFCGLVDDGGRYATATMHEGGWLIHLPASLFGGESDGAEASTLRRAAFNALSTQVRLANSHIEYLQGHLNGHALDPRFRPL